jgi:hypothetical protein
MQKDIQLALPRHQAGVATDKWLGRSRFHWKSPFFSRQIIELNDHITSFCSRQIIYKNDHFSLHMFVYWTICVIWSYASYLYDMLMYNNTQLCLNKLEATRSWLGLSLQPSLGASGERHIAMTMNHQICVSKLFVKTLSPHCWRFPIPIWSFWSLNGHH